MTNEHLLNRIKWVEKKAQNGFYRQVKLNTNGSRSVNWYSMKFFQGDEALTELGYNDLLVEKRKRNL